MVPQSFVDVLVAVALVGSVFLAMFAYTGNWPPLVVIESKSMQHSGTESEIGIMDTGDLAMVKTVASASEITSYAAALRTDYRTYGDFGDVVIYWRGGDQTKTPIIHRAVVFLDANEDGSFSAPELQWLTAGADYAMTNASDSWSHITSDFRLPHYGYRDMNLIIPVANMLESMALKGIDVHSGYITKGDFNSVVDQILFSNAREPVSFEWIHGVATGEIPWFGAVKLFLTGSLPEDTPANSIALLWASIAAIVAIPIGSEAYIWWRGRKEEGAEGAREGTHDAAERKPPGETPPTEKKNEKK